MSEVYSSFNLSRAPGPEPWFCSFCIPTFSPFAFTIFRSTRNLSHNGSMLREYQREQATERCSLSSIQAGAWCGNALGGGSHPSTNDERGVPFSAMQAMKGLHFAKAGAPMEDRGMTGDCQYAGSSDVFLARHLLCGRVGRQRGLKTWR
jgi:hypothetical protein